MMFAYLAAHKLFLIVLNTLDVSCLFGVTFELGRHELFVLRHLNTKSRNSSKGVLKSLLFKKPHKWAEEQRIG